MLDKIFETFVIYVANLKVSEAMQGAHFFLESLDSCITIGQNTY